MMKRIPKLIIALLLVTVVLKNESTHAAENIQNTMSKVAGVIQPILKKNGISSVSIGEFTGPPSFGSAAGTGMRITLVQELKKLGIIEKKLGTSVGVKGEFRPVKKQDGSIILRVNVTLVDASGEALSNLSVKVNLPDRTGVNVNKGTFGIENKSPSALAGALGANIDLMKKGEFGNFVSSTKGVEIINSFYQPKAFVNRNGGVSSSPQSEFNVDLLVNGRVRPAKLVDGHPFINLAKGETFKIRVRNNAKYDTGVSFFLDGVNSFIFSDVKNSLGNPKYSKWILKKKTSFTLKGWHKTNEHVEQFKVTDFEQSAASKIGSSSQLGTISVAFRGTWVPATEGVPEGEPQSAASKGIGFGEKELQKAIEDNKKRKYGILRSMVTIRYEKKK
jgi:hypothetical protein